MKVLVIVVTYNGAKWIDKCFGSLRNSSLPLDVMVIDNGSTDGTPAIIKSKYPEVEITEPKKNLGFGIANNIGLNHVLNENIDFAFLLNQDAWIQEDTIKKLIDFSTVNPEYGIISPLHLNGSGELIDPKFGFAIANQNFNYFNDLQFNKVSKVYDMTFVNAAVWLLPKKTIQDIGGFNEFYFMYGEDGDYCARVLWNNMKIGIVPHVYAHHARDNFHYKKRSFGKNLKFQIKEWHYWSYEEFLNFNIGFYQGIAKSINRVLVVIVNSTFKRQFSTALGAGLGWFKFIFNLNKAVKDKKTLSARKTHHFLNLP